jgi:lathosterol oxidase
MQPNQVMSFAELWLWCFMIVSVTSLVSSGIGVALEWALGDSKRIWSVPLRENQLRNEKRSYLQFVLLLSTTAAAWLSIGAIEFRGEGLLVDAMTFVLLWTAFEIYYYGLHRALHSRPLYRFHAHHHESHVTTAWSGQSLSPVEALGWIAGLLIPPALFCLVVPISLTGCLIYFVANTFVNLVGHANVELNPISARGLTWLTHPWIYHALHHARFKNHYSFASTFMDRLFRTEWSDWPKLHASVFAGKPLERLSERG